MVIQCSSCNTRFKLADDKLKPEGVKVRCSKCKEVFTVMPPDEVPSSASLDIAADDASAGGASDWSDLGHDASADSTAAPDQSEAGGIDWSDMGGDEEESGFDADGASDTFSFGDDDSSSAAAGIAFEDDAGSSGTDDFSFDDRSDAVKEDDFGFDDAVGEGVNDEFSFDDEPASGLGDSDDAPDFDWDGSGESGTSDDFDFGDSDDAGSGDLDFSSVALEEKEPAPAPTPAPEPVRAPLPIEQQEKPLSAKGPQKTTDKKRGRTLKKKKKKKGSFRGLLLFILIILILAGGHLGILYWKGFWNGDPAELANLDHQNVHLQAYQQIYAELTGGQVAKAPEGKITPITMNGHFVENQAVGTLFVIEGQVRNDFQEPRSAIAVRGILFDNTGKPVVRKKVYCGNQLNGSELQTLSLDKINERLNNQFGNSLSNLDVAPGAVLPYIVVFDKLPENLSEYNVEVAESSPGSR